MSGIDSGFQLRLGRRVVLSDQEIIGRNGWFIPDVLGTWVEGSAVDHVGYLSPECSPLLFSECLVLAHTVECLSNRFDK